MMDISELIEQARQAQKRAHAPYSRYPVGAAVLTESGKIFLGCNVESGAFSTTICAERAAIFAAIAAGESQFRALAIISNDGGMPCGSCRQVIHEQCGELPIYIVGANSQLHKEFSTSQLLPYPFDLKES
ncbi:MAG: cytidine deaminase [Fidelibacterota bacterium]|nr:MAG: cytidine deaminase [Candidatus Neomarinimicrobiota bacterium]